MIARPARWLALAALVAAAATATGCAAMKLGYNNADTLALFSLDGYLDLNAEQELTVKERVNSLVAWHRSTQLRDYVQTIETARAKLGGAVTAADVADFNQHVNTRMLIVGDRAAPDIAHVALTLAPEQIDRAAKKMADDAAKERRELAKNADKDTGGTRVKKANERAESWFGGRLNDAQKELIRKTIAARPADGTWWIDEKERRQRDFIVLLRKIHAERPSEEAAARWLRAYFKQLNVVPDAERRARTEAYRRENAEMVAHLINLATPEQRAALDKKLADYAQDFRSLAGNGSG